MGKSISKLNPERKRERYGKEFKLEAVRLLELGQKPATQLALELGIARNQLNSPQRTLRGNCREVRIHRPASAAVPPLHPVPCAASVTQRVL